MTQVRSNRVGSDGKLLSRREDSDTLCVDGAGRTIASRVNHESTVSDMGAVGVAPTDVSTVPIIVTANAPSTNPVNKVTQDGSTRPDSDIKLLSLRSLFPFLFSIPIF